MMTETAGIRRLGSAALDLAYVAAGRMDGFWEDALAPWDLAAGILMVREAGGFATDRSGGRDMFDNGTIVAGNEASFAPDVHVDSSGTLVPTGAALVTIP